MPRNNRLLWHHNEVTRSTQMTVEIIDGDSHEHRQFKMTIARKTFFQFFQPLLELTCRFVYALLTDIFNIKFVVTLHAHFLDLALRPVPLHFLYGKLVCLGESHQLFVGWNASTVLQLAYIARGKAEPFRHLFDTPIIRFSLLF